MALLLAACAMTLTLDCAAVDSTGPASTPARSGEPPAEATNGWVELTVADSQVPAAPATLPTTRGRSQDCELEVEIDGETVLFEVLRPEGTAPPFSVDATFRFPVSPGVRAATIYYSSCRTSGRQLDSLEARLRISVRRGHVTRVRFDGSTIRTYAPADPRLEDAAG